MVGLTTDGKNDTLLAPKTRNKKKGIDTMRSEKSYKVDTEKKIIYCFRGVKQSARDEKDIEMYIKCGYEIKWVKAPLTVAKMRRELKALAPAETYEAFEKAYKEKAPEGNTDFNETGFSKACKIYNTWRRAYNKKLKEEKAKTEE